MSDAPEYVYAWKEKAFNTCSEDSYSAGIPYRRADLVDAEIERLRAALKSIAYNDCMTGNALAGTAMGAIEEGKE